jgi:hypothetical protein
VITGLCDADRSRESSLFEHPEHLLGGDDQQAEGQVGGDLDRSAHPDVPTSVLIVQMAVDPLDGAALAIAHRFGGRELDLLTAARIVVDDPGKSS